MGEKIAVIGLGYVGLPVAMALAKHFPGTMGFDIDAGKISCLKRGTDRTGEISEKEIHATPLAFTSDIEDLQDITFFVVAVPTPVDHHHRPDVRHLLSASELIGKVLKSGSVVVYESTVYPGMTEDICGPVLAKSSGLQQGIDFKLGYSPERINPGDKDHTLERIVKVVSGEDEETLERVSAVYGKVVTAGIHKAPSIKVAEAAKVIENTQRDLNIALMNELALIFDRLGIRTRDVLAAAKTKWNFLPFSPGLVGGHCIGVDPYYLTTKAEELGYLPQVILAGRRINDGMGAFLAQRMVKLLVHADISVKCARVGILGLTFKENVPDIRNSRIPDIVLELKQFGIQPLVHDPVASGEEALHEYGIALAEWSEMQKLDGLILAVSHNDYLKLPLAELKQCLKPGGVLMDVKSALEPEMLSADIHYWCL